MLLGCAFAYTILTLVPARLHEDDSKLAQAIGNDRKGRVSLALYVVSLAFAFVVPWVSVALFVSVAVIWFVPDRGSARVVATGRRARGARRGRDVRRRP